MAKKKEEADRQDLAKSVQSDEQEALAVVPPEENALAIPDEELDGMFGGKDAPLPIDVAPPTVKMTKTSDFELPNGDKVKELVGYMVFAKRSLAYFATKYSGGKGIPPDCASDNCYKPNDNIEKPENTHCGNKICPKATWRKTTDASGKAKNEVDCKESLNLIFLQEGLFMPIFMRIRSLSMNPKSPIALFFAACSDPAFAYRKKFQTVKVKLTLKEIEKNGFETSILEVEKLSVLEATDPLLPILGKMFQKLKTGFVVVHEDVPVDAESEEYDPEKDAAGDYDNPDRPA